MATSDLESTPNPQVDDTAASRSVPASDDRLRTGRLLAIALAAGLLAGGLSWGAGELAYGAFRPRLFRVAVMASSSMQPSVESQNQADFKNATLAFVLLGAVTGLVMGAAGGLVRRARGRGVLAALVGLAGGGAAAGLVSGPLLRLYYRQLTPSTNDLMLPLMVHGGIWAAVGAAAGLAFGLGCKSGRRLPGAIAGACVGAIIAAILYEVIGAALSPDSGSTEPLPASWKLRLLARVLVALFAAAGAGLTLTASARDTH